jgi:hypothetical protein
MSCPLSTRCTLHAQLRASSALAVWQTLFCESGFNRCARYRMSMSRALVPVDLLPDGITHLPPRLTTQPTG